MAQPGLTYNIDDSQVQRRVKTILANLADLTPVMDTIGEIGKASIQRNFEQGGRPKKWADLAESTKAQRIKTKTWPGQILVRKGELQTISFRADEKSVVLMPADVPWAAIQHFGGMAGRNRKTKIPARAYMMLQTEDGIEIVAVLEKFVMED